MKKENIESGLSLGNDDAAIVRHNKEMDKDRPWFMTVKLILEDNDIPVKYPTGFNYKVANTAALGSWSEAYKRTLIQAYIDSIVEQSGMKVTALMTQEKLFEVLNKTDELKRLVEAVWKVRYPRFFQSETLHQEYIRKFIMSYVYSEDAKREAKRVWAAIGEMRHYGMNNHQIRSVFVSHGIHMDCHTLSTSAVEKQAKVQYDDPLLSANVKGSVCNLFEVFVPKKKRSMGLPKIPKTAREFIDAGQGHLLKPSILKDELKKMKSLF